MKSCTIITCNNCEFYNKQSCKNCSKEGDDCYEHWEWRHDISWRQEQIDNLTQKIADLEAKLAESEKELKMAQKLHTELFLSYENLKDNYDQLKQQLAEEKLQKQDIFDLYEMECKKTFKLNYDNAGLREKIESLTTAGQYKLSPSNDKVIREMVLDGKEILMMPKDIVDYLNAYSKELADNVQCIEILRKELEKYKNTWHIDLDSLKIDENVQKVANQKAITELKKAKIEFETYYADNIWNYPQYLEDRIKLLKEEK